MATSNEIEFEILLRPRDRSREVDSSAGVSRHAAPDEIERCRQWLAAQGVVVYPTSFSLVCRAACELFEKVFETKLEPTGIEAGSPAWKYVQKPRIPNEIAECVVDVTVAARPELF